MSVATNNRIDVISTIQWFEDHQEWTPTSDLYLSLDEEKCCLIGSIWLWGEHSDAYLPYIDELVSNAKDVLGASEDYISGLESGFGAWRGAPEEMDASKMSQDYVNGYYDGYEIRLAVNPKSEED